MYKLDYKKSVRILKALAHPLRIKILEMLLKSSRKKCVQDFGKILERRQANISQHLAILRNAGIVDYIEKGKNRCYFIKNSRIIREMLNCLKESKSLLK